MKTPAQAALAKKCDAKVRSLVATNGRNMAEIAYTLLKMRDDGLHRAFNESTIAGYAVKRGVTRSRAQARELVLVAERVQRWPRFKAAFDRGDLDWTKVRDGLRLLEQLGGNRRDEVLMLRQVQECTSRELERAAARARGRDPAGEVTHAFRHSPERDGRLEQALQLVRSRGSGKETDAEALARIVEEWLAATEQADKREVGSTAEAPSAQGGQPTETRGAHGGRTTEMRGDAPTPDGAAAAHERLDGGREAQAAASRILRVLPGGVAGPAPGTDRLQLRLFGPELEVRVTTSAILLRVPDLDTVVSMAVRTQLEVPASRTDASREASSPASSACDTTNGVEDVSRAVPRAAADASPVAETSASPEVLAGSGQRVADAG